MKDWTDNSWIRPVIVWVLALLALLLFCVQKANSQIRFDDVDDMLHTSAAQSFSALNFTNVISVSFWLVKHAGLDNADEFIGKGRVANGNVSHWAIRDDSTGGFDFYFANPAATFRIFSTTGTWTQTNVPTHVGFTYNWTSSNSAQFYVNGMRVAGIWTFNPANTTGLTNAEPFRIGTTYSGSTIAGQISEVAVWNGILTDPEMATLGKARRARLPLKIQPQQLRLYMPLSGFWPAFTTASGSNAIVSMDPYRTPTTPLNSPQQRPAIFSR